jgi:hypothetical protein
VALDSVGPRVWAWSGVEAHQVESAVRKGVSCSRLPVEKDSNHPLRGNCPGKSLPAQAIEESVLGRIRDAQHGRFDPSEWQQMDRTRQVEAIHAVVERIGYDGTARQISIRFHANATMAGEETTI